MCDKKAKKKVGYGVSRHDALAVKDYCMNAYSANCRVVQYPGVVAALSLSFNVSV